jgi:hypothetical protein
MVLLFWYFLYIRRTDFSLLILIASFYLAQSIVYTLMYGVINDLVKSVW